MVGRLEAGGRIAAAALLALGSLAPVGGPLLVATPIPVVDESAGCPVTVGTATTDAALAADAARAIAVGYAITDCLPDAQLLAAAEARAAMALGNTTPAPATTATTGTLSGALAGARSSGSGLVAAPGTTTTAAPPPTPASAAADPATVAPTETTTTSATDTTTTGTDSDDGTSSGSDGGTSSDSNDGTSSGTDGDGDSNNDPTSEVPTSELPGDDAGCPESGSVAAADTTTTDGTATNGTTTTAPATNAATTTAAARLGWGVATGVEDFDDPGLANWSCYDGPGHAGNGVRSPSAMSVTGGVLTITGDANGTTGGMAWKLGRSQFGRWEARVRAPAADPSYNAVMLLWPDAENWPEGGEVDFMEIGDETRQQVDFFLHYGAENHQLHGSTQIDATQWHNWAVEWSPTKITGYVDGTEWFSTTQADALPPGSMHLTLQLDWFPKGGSVQQSTMDVDWVRYYPIDGSGAPGTIVNSLGTTSATGSALSETTAGTTTGVGGDLDNGGQRRRGRDPLIREQNTPTSTSPARATATGTSAITGAAASAAGGASANGADATGSSAGTVGAGPASTVPGGSSAAG